MSDNTDNSAQPAASPPHTFCGLPWGQLLRFVLVGIGNTVVGYILFRMGLWIFGKMLPGHEPMARALAWMASYCVGIFWAYYWHSKITFQVDPFQNLRRTGSRFIWTQALLAVTGNGLLEAGVQVSGLSPKIVWFGVAAVVTLLNYLLQKFWVFR
jgi:putative flippase GtrA